jgi:hypothetical protein
MMLLWAWKLKVAEHSNSTPIYHITTFVFYVDKSARMCDANSPVVNADFLINSL